MTTDFEICIVGAGPAGASLSQFLSKKKIHHILVDKDVFPRDKICGDGISIDVMHALKRMGDDMLEDFLSYEDLLPSWGISFGSSGKRELRLDFKDEGFPYPPFFTAKRLHLDNYLIEKLNTTYCKFLTGTKVVGLDRNEKRVKVSIKNQDGESEFDTKIIVGAEGEKAVVTKYLGLQNYREKDHLMAALRVYYKDVKGLNTNNHIELYFDKNVLPGYFWIFPLPNNEANVGLGMLSSTISKNKVNLKKVLANIIHEHPTISKMFEGATAMETQKGWGLPTMTSKRTIAGERFALIGDAAGMIEPFTGKGIGPGMASARICADHLETALKTNDFQLMSYQEHMYRYYKNEMKVGYALQSLLKYPKLLNSMFYLSSQPMMNKWINKKVADSWRKYM